MRGTTSVFIVVAFLVPFFLSSCATMPVQGPPVLDSDKDGVPDNYDNRNLYKAIPPYQDYCPNTPTGVKVDANGCPFDTDKDGVPDYLDKCPGTPAGLKVNADGCPLDADGDGVPDHLDKCPGTPKGVKVDANGCPLDADGDGVPDYLDKCPSTPAGVKVDGNGCPLDADGDGVPDYLDKCAGTPKGVKVDENGCPLDADGDGVPDYLDKCANTPAGVKVDANGCPLDGDGDGVPDYLDKCAGTPPGVKVDANGCPVQEKAQAKERIAINVEFDFDKAVIKKEYHDEIGKLAEVLKKRPDVKITIEGHTDDTGSLAYNEKLSQRRADAVKSYLVEQFGIDASRLSTKGYGELRPVAPNATEDGRQKNRRAEAVVE